MTAYARPLGDLGGAHDAAGGMQEDRLELPMAAPCVCTVGGNTMLVNGNEADTLDHAIESTPYRSGDLSNEDDSHVMGVYRQQADDFAGS